MGMFLNHVFPNKKNIHVALTPQVCANKGHAVQDVQQGDGAGHAHRVGQHAVLRQLEGAACTGWVEWRKQQRCEERHAVPRQPRRAACRGGGGGGRMGWGKQQGSDGRQTGS